MMPFLFMQNSNRQVPSSCALIKLMQNYRSYVYTSASIKKKNYTLYF